MPPATSTTATTTATIFWLRVTQNPLGFHELSPCALAAQACRSGLEMRLCPGGGVIAWDDRRSSPRTRRGAPWSWASASGSPTRARSCTCATSGSPCSPSSPGGRQVVLGGLLGLERLEDVALGRARIEVLEVGGVVRGRVGSLGLGAPWNVTPRPVRQDWNVATAENRAVVGFCWASGIVTLAAFTCAPCAPPAGRSAWGIWPAAT